MAVCILGYALSVEQTRLWCTRFGRAARIWIDTSRLIRQSHSCMETLTAWNNPRNIRRWQCLRHGGGQQTTNITTSTIDRILFIAGWGKLTHILSNDVTRDWTQGLEPRTEPTQWVLRLFPQLTLYTSITVCIFFLLFSIHSQGWRRENLFNNQGLL